MSIHKRLTLAASGVTKFTSSGKRRIRGYASTDRSDLVSDIVDPRGGSWTLPLPLLLNHVATDPVGWVRSIEVRGQGLWIEAELAEGVGKADETWSLIDAGLTTGYSIGFLPTASEPIPGTRGGKRFTAYTVYEVSITTIPCNPDARIQRGIGDAIPLVRRDGIPLIKTGVPHV